MDVVRSSDLRVGSFRLEGFEHDLKFELGAVGTITHGARDWIGSGSQEN